MDSPTPRSPLPATGKLIVGAIAFGGLTVLGVVALIRWRPPAEIDGMLAALTPAVVATLLSLLALDFIMSGVRYRLLLDGKIFSHVSLWHCIRANWANMLLGAITPAQTGGGAAQLYVLYRRGALASEAVLASLLTFAATLSFFAVGGLAALAFMPANTLPTGVTAALVATMAAVSVLAGLLIAAIMSQSWTVHLLRRLITKVTRRGTRVRRWGAIARRALSREIGRLVEGIRAVATRGRITLVWVALATAVLYLNKYVIGYVLATALQGSVDPSFIGLQLLQNVVLYFAPTPGAAGVAEASSGLLLNPVLAVEITVLWVVGWRLLTTFVGTVLGALVLFVEARRHVGDVRAEAKT